MSSFYLATSSIIHFTLLLISIFAVVGYWDNPKKYNKWISKNKKKTIFFTVMFLFIVVTQPYKVKQSQSIQHNNDYSISEYHSEHEKNTVEGLAEKRFENRKKHVEDFVQSRDEYVKKEAQRSEEFFNNIK